MVVATYRVARLVVYSSRPLPEDESQSLMVRLENDRQFVKDFRDNSYLRDVMIYFMTGR